MSTDYNFECDKCPRTFKLEEFYEKHKKVHELKKQHRCDVCGFVYGAAKGLEGHLKTHTDLQLAHEAATQRSLASAAEAAVQIAPNATSNNLKFKFYEPVDVSKNEEEGHKSTSSKKEVTATNRYQKSPDNTEKNSDGVKIKHGCQQTYKRDHEYDVEKSKSQASIIDNDNHESCMKIIEISKSVQEDRPLECQKCVTIAIYIDKDCNICNKINSLRNRLLSGELKWVRGRCGRSKGVAQENLECTQKFSDLQSSLNKAVGEKTHLLKENTSLLQKNSDLDTKYQDIRKRYEESTKNVQHANDQLKKKQILLDDAILSGENLMYFIKKINERILICKDLAKARNQDAIKSDNKLKDLGKQCDHLTNELKESQQKYELQSKDFQEVIKKVNEYELLLNEASKRCNGVINELTNLTQND